MAHRKPHHVGPLDLGDARQQLHHAAQVLGSSAHAWLAHAEDDSHANLGFDAARGSLYTRELGRGLALHLDLEPCELVLRRGSEAVAHLALSGRRIEEALAWAQAQLDALLDGSRPIPLREFEDFPDLPFLGGAPFATPQRAQNAALAGWFALGVELFDAARSRESGLGEARIWPHHFDLGALRRIDDERSLGLGLSPGDSYYDQPYFYASPYPAPQAAARPTLAVGHWHSEDFVSAVATGAELSEAGPLTNAARRWLDSALGACRALLG